MEYMVGGDCSSLLRNLGALEEKTARIYIAETVAALENLHQIQGIVHRLVLQQIAHATLSDSILHFRIRRPNARRTLGVLYSTAGIGTGIEPKIQG